VLRTNRDTGKVERFSTWCAKAIARIGKLTDTLKDTLSWPSLKYKYNLASSLSLYQT
jgi:hypothetical protein